MSIFQNYGTKMEPKVVQRPDRADPLYRVYVQDTDGTYTMFLGGGLTRVFTTDNLPDQLRIKLAMIHAQNWEDYMPVSGWTTPLLTPRKLSREMYDIGWRTSRFEYCFVMDQQLFDELRGTSVQKCTLSGHDSRGQSQSEGEESS